MFVRIWRFTVEGPYQPQFEDIYRSDGDWARLFARAPGFLGTELLRVPAVDAAQGAAAYVTIDRWRDRSDWLRFRREHDQDYRMLDLRCEPLTAEEIEIGDFSPVA